MDRAFAQEIEADRRQVAKLPTRPVGETRGPPVALGSFEQLAEVVCARGRVDSPSHLGQPLAPAGSFRSARFKAAQSSSAAASKTADARAGPWIRAAASPGDMAKTSIPASRNARDNPIADGAIRIAGPGRANIGEAVEQPAVGLARLSAAASAARSSARIASSTALGLLPQRGVQAAPEDPRPFRRRPAHSTQFSPGPRRRPLAWPPDVSPLAEAA